MEELAGRTKEELDNNIFQASSIAQKHSCNLIRLDFQQEQGLVSTLPLAYNEVDIQRGMTTSSTAIFVPFTLKLTLALLGAVIVTF